MFTVVTTANYPDVMLPAYYDNFYVFFLFLVYALLSIYLLLSVLMANVFNKYTERL